MPERFADDILKTEDTAWKRLNMTAITEFYVCRGKQELLQLFLLFYVTI